jgi:flagellar P-ring protein precursor FlgI
MTLGRSSSLSRVSPMNLPDHPSSAMRAWLWALAAAFAVVLLPATARADKLRELTEIGGARDNQLVGYGIVTGLDRTGDDFTIPFAGQSLLSLLRRLGVQIDQTQLNQQMLLRNVAAVVVTATCPRSPSRGRTWT